MDSTPDAKSLAFCNSARQGRTDQRLAKRVVLTRTRPLQKVSQP